MTYTNWIDIYLANYKGETDEAKECEKFLKQNYKGNPYLPWAFMIRSMLQQDPDATFNVIIPNPSLPENILFMNEYSLSSFQESNDNSKRTGTNVLSPMVGVKVTFFGKTFEDLYPIQDNDYSAPRSVNQNMINKAKQRALARCISMATGIGWRLYEGQYLQFEDTQQPKKRSAQVKIEKPALSPSDASNTSMLASKVTAINNGTVETKEIDLNAPAEIPDPVAVVNNGTDLVEFLLNYEDKDVLNRALASLNTSCIKKYGFAFTTEDTKDELVQKVAKLANAEKFLASVKNKIKVVTNA